MNEIDKQIGWTDGRTNEQTNRTKKKISIAANAECCCFAEPEIDVT